MRFVHGSTEFGNRKARSPSAMTMVVRTAGEASFSNTVNSSGKRDSHTADDVLMYRHNAIVEDSLRRA